MRMGILTDSLDKAVKWARTKIPVATTEVVRCSPWGATLHAKTKAGDFYLKVLPPRNKAIVTDLAAIAKVVPDFVAEVIAVDPAEGFALSADHQGRSLVTDDDPNELILRSYAKLQSIAAGNLNSLIALGQYDPAVILESALQFLQPPADGDTKAHLSQFLGLRYSDFVCNALVLCQKPIEKLLNNATILPLTLNHCDLHSGNVGFDANGNCKFHDWDNALIGPAGLSLSGIVGSTADLIAAHIGKKSIHSGDACRYQTIYSEALRNAGYASEGDLDRALVGAALAGLLLRLVNYAPYRPGTEQERELCVNDLNRICSDLLDCCQVLAEQDQTLWLSFAELLSRNQFYDKLMSLCVRTDNTWLTGAAQSERGGLFGLGEVDHVARLALAYKHAKEPGTVPLMAVSPLRQLERGLSSLEADVATRIFIEQGALALVNAFPHQLLSDCLAQYLALGGSGSGVPLQVGDKRMMEALSLRGAFNTPSLYAQPLLMKMFENLLGADFVIGSMTIVVSQPGSQAQHLHIDHPNIFGDTIEGAGLPPHAITVLVPLIDIDEEVGGTKVVKGSHLVPFAVGKVMPHQSQSLPLGSCLMFDYRLFHGGLPNRSNRNRPVLSVVYHRAWFRDATNFGLLEPLQVPQHEFNQIPEEKRQLFRYASVSDSKKTRKISRGS